MNKLLFFIIAFFTIGFSFAQNAEPIVVSTPNGNGCATDDIMQQVYKLHPEMLERQKQSERNYLQAVAKGSQASWRSADVVTIPVVVHVMYLPGTPVGTNENVSAAQIEVGIQHLTQAFRKQTDDFKGIGRNANIVGADVQLEFCLAKQDPSGNATNGINRVATTLSNLDIATTTNQFAMKDLSRWDTERYLNIWLVKEICSGTNCSTAGFAYYSGAHGRPFDGVVDEARFFGTSTNGSKIHIHEVGHYFNLAHTFGDAATPVCTNNNCLTDGDRVCDTPPDISTSAVSCGNPQNSCTTDADDTNVRNPYRPAASGGLGNQEDLYEDYMDYSYQNCQNTYTEGQKTRMRVALDGDRVLLKTSLGCVSPTTAALAYFGDGGGSTNESVATTTIDCRKYVDVNVPIRLFNPSPSSVTVNLSIGSGTASNNADFQLTTPSVLIAAGATTGNATLRIFNDKDIESLETVVLNISSATAGVAPFNSNFTYGILDNDVPLSANTTPISSTMTTTSEYLGPNSTVNFVSATSELLMTIQNLTNHDYGCTTVEIDRAGVATVSSVGKTFTSKTFKVTPTTNNASGTNRVTLYYSGSEVSGWTNATGSSTSNMSIFKSSGAISAASSLTEGTSINASNFGTSTAFTATFTTGFSGFGIANGAVLAVDLLTFEGIKGNKNVKLRWKTASEKNNDYFVIEKSRDGQTFEDLTKVTSQGISSDILNYETFDNAPATGMNYYRLKSVDKGGQVATSKVVSVAFVEKIKLTVYPNPTTTSKINVELTSDRDARIDFEVVDIVGRTIHTLSQNVTNGLNTIAFDNLSIAKGIYFIRAKQNNVVTDVVRFIRL